METTRVRRRMGIMHLDGMGIVFHSGDAWDSMPQNGMLKYPQLFVQTILSYVKCMGLPGNFSLTLSISQ